jgi:hypothetical protein
MFLLVEPAKLRLPCSLCKWNEGLFKIVEYA